jgi:serine/alanine adding enzyme
MLTDTALTVRIAGDHDLPAWQDFVDRMPDAGPLHHAAWYHILRDAYSVAPYFLIAEDGSGEIGGILPTYLSRSRVAGRHLTSLEGGILATSEDATKALLAAALQLRDANRALYFQIRGGAPLEGVSVVPTVHTIIQTYRDVDALWTAVKRKTRWGIRQAEKQDLCIEADPRFAHLDAFYHVYARHMRDLGTPVFGKETFCAMHKHLGPERLRLYLVKHREDLIGGMLCIIHGNNWTDWYAVVRTTNEIEFANYLLYWHVIRDASQQGAETFDLGRSTPGSNVHLFKRKWGGLDVEVPYYFYPVTGRLNIDPGLQQMKQSKGWPQRIWSRLPLGVCNIAGPLLRRQLPFI